MGIADKKPSKEPKRCAQCSPVSLACRVERWQGVEAMGVPTPAGGQWQP